MHRHTVPVRRTLIPTAPSVAGALGQHLVDHRLVDCLHPARWVSHGGGWEVPIEMTEPSVVAKFDELEVDVRVSQQLQLLDILNHFPGFVGDKGLYKRW